GRPAFWGWGDPRFARARTAHLFIERRTDVGPHVRFMGHRAAATRLRRLAIEHPFHGDFLRLGGEDDYLDAAVLGAAVGVLVAGGRALIGVADHGHAEGADLALLQALPDRDGAVRRQAPVVEVPLLDGGRVL